VRRLAAAHPDQRLAVVAHGGVIGQALALAAASRPFAFLGADNASISRLVVAGDRWIVRGFNDTAHLD
jgi:2,3-bisphosphoglycerate-dependent phosphoglycerate mutase